MPMRSIGGEGGDYCYYCYFSNTITRRLSTEYNICERVIDSLSRYMQLAHSEYNLTQQQLLNTHSPHPMDDDMQNRSTPGVQQKAALTAHTWLLGGMWSHAQHLTVGDVMFCFI